MKRKVFILVAIVLGLILAGVVVWTKFLSKEKPGALQVQSTPRATVFVDGSQVGITPYFSDEISVGEHQIKLVPEASGEDLIDWEGQVEVFANILTAVNWEMAADESSSAGEILTLEKSGNKETSSLAIISDPSQAVVKLDGQPKDFTPVQLEDLNPGDYQVTVSAPGYREKTIPAHTVAGYKLIIDVKLAQEVEGVEEAGEVEGEEEEVSETEEEEEAEAKTEEEEATPTPSSPGPTTTPPAKPYVVIKETSTGWLRVRSEPSTGENSEELARVYPGEMYPYLDEKQNGWYKIEYQSDEEGWISGVYADLVE